MNVLSLFSGIGGLELGLERAGMTVVGQVEIDPFCQQVLAKHWPEVPKHDDVRTAVDWWRSEPRPPVHVVAGGFPCQGHSVAGKQLGTDDERWGWPWFREVVAGTAPPWVLIENVRNLVRTGLRDVLIDLAALGFDAWWGCVPAAAVGAAHLRWRLFVIAAHPERVQLRQQPGWEFGAHREGPAVLGHDGASWVVADADAQRRWERTGLLGAAGRAEPADSGRWPAEPDVARVAHGVPGGVDRRRSLGNAVVPQVSEFIGRLVMAEVPA